MITGFRSTAIPSKPKQILVMSLSHDFVIYGFFEVKCQLLIVYFVGFGCQPTILLNTIRQSFEPSYTQIQAAPANFF